MKSAILSFVLSGVFSFVMAQDTSRFENREKFDQWIQYSFKYLTGGLNKDIRKKIDKEFKKYDFTAEKYECNFHFDFNVKLDSLGRIKKCEQSVKYEDEQFERLANNIRQIILTSNWQPANWVHLKDTSYLIDFFHVTISGDCESATLSYNISDRERNHKPYVWVVKDKNEDLYFTGFEYYMDASKKCKKEDK
ncbi:hypothetical protein [Fluviicola taffensis]|uniref:hypothetical protein n=1 Tax=Fluviicola taffensis TaxID=191579 RepID=UPI0031381C00